MQKTAKKVELKTFFFQKGWLRSSHLQVQTKFPLKTAENDRTLENHWVYLLVWKGKKKIEIFITFSKLLKWQRLLRPPLYKIKCFPSGLVEFKLKCMKQRIIKYKLPFLGLPVHPRVGSNMLQWKVLHEVTLLFNIVSIILYNKQTQN